MTNPYLEGVYGPVSEEVTAFDLPVTGRIPAGLDGRYLRNGPNPLNIEDPLAHHWMLGEGMIHGVRLRDGRAEWYRNRWVRSVGVKEKLGEPVTGSPPEGDFAPNTHVIRHSGRTLALIEGGPLPYELDDELGTVGPCDFGGTLEGAFTAHTKFDHEARELHAVTYFPMWDHVRHLVVGAGGTVERTTKIPLAGAPMMHDFALTGRYVVLIDQPVTFDMDAAMAGEQVPYIWNETHQARVGVLPREGGETRWIDIEPCYVAHTLNAYDDGDTVVLDLVRYPRMDVRANLATMPALERWTIDLTAGTMTRRVIDDRPQEFPRVNDRYVARRHRYGYAAVIGRLNETTMTPGDDPIPDDAFGNALVKHDHDRDLVEVHRFGHEAAVSEPVYAEGGEPGEDGGYVLSYVHNPDRGAADLVILSAQDFTGEPVARVHLPARIPLGFHGSWLPDE